MANSYFKFKQFVVNQERCAMKVGTDGVLLGSWTDVSCTNNVLDIGTGTGLIALMLAQRNPNLSVMTIDIDKGAILQAKENFLTSPFAQRIDCQNISIKEFTDKNYNKYDLIVSNPPYFANSLKSPHLQRTLARHTDSLPLGDLFQFTTKLLSEDGKFSIIYPYDSKELLLSLADEYHLYPKRITNVLPTLNSKPRRVLIEFHKNSTDLVETDLIIETERNVYSSDFIKLIQDFYLKY